jgi:ERCC4-type nuclease
MWEIIIDDRERPNKFEHVQSFLSLFDDTDIKVKVERLNIADFGVFYNGVLIFIIERKTWNDLAGSITNGHLNEQIQNMLNIICSNDNKNNDQANESINKYNQISPDIIPFILVEGKKKNKHMRIPIENLESKLDHLIIRHPIFHILYSKNMIDTKEHILRLIKNYPVDLLPNYTYDGGNILKQKTEISIEEHARRCLSKCPSISYASSEIILKHWSIRELLSFDEKKDENKLSPININTISSLKYISGNIIGESRAKKIIRALKQKDTKIKILSEIKGLTKQSTKKILDELPNISQWTIDNIKDINKTEKRKIGIKLSTNINDIIDYYHE